MSPCSAPVCPLTVIAWRLGGSTLSDLWWRYLTVGGDHPQAALAAYLDGSAAWPDTEHDVLAQVLNEALWELGIPSLAPHRAPRPAVQRAGQRRRDARGPGALSGRRSRRSRAPGRGSVTCRSAEAR
ncbi:hypothetical protein ACI798_18665 [Geodermatophilus sp. SYSU D01045]